MNKITCLILAGLIIPTMANANVGDKYLYGGIGNVGISGNEIGGTGAKNPSYAIGMGYYFTDNFAIEGFYRYSSLEKDNWLSSSKLTVDQSQFGLSLVGITDQLQSTPIQFFAKLTAFTSRVGAEASLGGDIFSTNDNITGFNAAAGVQWNIDSQYFARLEYTHNLSMSDLEDSGSKYEADGYDGFQLSAGINF